MSMKLTLSSQNSKPRTPNSPVSPTVRQLLQAERLSNYLSNNNINNNVISPKLGKDSQQDDDRFNFNFEPTKKLSVLAKVKEKARKWKQSIGKKKPGQDTDSSSSWGAAYEDYDKDETPRRLGTTPSKLYGLRRSSSSYREGGGLSRQRSLSGLSISEKHVLSCSVDRGYNEQCERIPQKESSQSPIKRLPSLRDDGKRLTPIKTKPNEPKIEEYHDDPVEDVEKDKPPPSYEEVMQDSKEKHMTPQKSNIEEAKVESLDSIKTIERIQEAITIEEAKELNQICLKIIHGEKGKNRPTPSPEEGAFQEEKKQEVDSPSTKGKSLAEAVTEKLTPTTSTSNSEEQGFELPKPLRVNTTRIEAPVCVIDESDDDDNLEENGIAGECKWDKGVSVKEYIKNKLEPGEDERALSQVISEAISPRRTPGDKGVMEKVKEAVTLLLLAEQRQVERQEEKHKQQQHHHQQQQQQQQKQQQQQQQQQQQRQQPQQQQQQQYYQQQQQQHQHYQLPQRSSSQSMRHSSSSLQIPVSTNAYEDELNVEEESHGRILQAN